MPQSGQQPNKINIVKVNNQAKIRLTDNVTTQTEIDENDDEKTTYVYDEVVYMLPYRSNLEADVTANFETYWNFGVQKKNEKRKTEIAKRLAELDKEVSRVEEDLIEQFNVTVHQSKIDVITEKASLRNELAGL